MYLKRDAILQLKKFVPNIDKDIEDIYLHVNERNEVYLVTFHKKHVFLNYLKIGESDKLTGTYLLALDYNNFRKFINKVRVSDMLELTESSFRHTFYNGTFNEEYSFIKEETSKQLDLDHFLQDYGQVELCLTQYDMRILGINEDMNTYYEVSNNTVYYTFYDDKKNIVAEYKEYNWNGLKDTAMCFHNSFMLNMLSKFNNKKYSIHCRMDYPIIIRAGDYTGLLACRLYDKDEMKSILGD